MDTHCVCKHGRFEHCIKDGIATWCTQAGKVCDCFQFKPLGGKLND